MNPISYKLELLLRPTFWQKEWGTVSIPPLLLHLQSAVFLNREALLSVTHTLVISPMDVQCALHRLPLKSFQKLQLVQNVAVRTVLAFLDVHVTHPLQELCWLPVCFQIQFKILDATFKAIHGKGLGYLMINFIQITLSHAVHSDKKNMLWVLLVKEFQLEKYRKRPFSAIGTPYPLEVRCIPPSILSQKEY